MSEKYLQVSECRDVIFSVFATLQVKDLQLATEVSFSNRMTSAMGRAITYIKSKKSEIRLSTPLFERASEEERFQVLVHEACHIVQQHVKPKESSHGHYWESLMRRMGQRPDRCHNVDTTGLKKKETVYCYCGPQSIGPVRYKRIVRGEQTYTCRTCKQRVTTTALPSRTVLTFLLPRTIVTQNQENV